MNKKDIRFQKIYDCRGTLLYPPPQDVKEELDKAPVHFWYWMGDYYFGEKTKVWASTILKNGLKYRKVWRTEASEYFNLDDIDWHAHEACYIKQDVYRQVGTIQYLGKVCPSVLSAKDGDLWVSRKSQVAVPTRSGLKVVSIPGSGHVGDNGTVNWEVRRNGLEIEIVKAQTYAVGSFPNSRVTTWEDEVAKITPDGECIWNISGELNVTEFDPQDTHKFWSVIV